MRRIAYIVGSDGMSCPDDLTPRCMDAKDAPRRAVSTPDTSGRSKALWPRAFAVRVEDAMALLKRGVHPDRVREKHGAIVVKQAASELLPKARVLA